MADQKGLRFIGLGFAAITAAVMLMASLIVADAARDLAPKLPQSASASAANG